MKTITLLFTLYIMVLACYPCMDQNDCADDLQNGVVTMGVADHSHSPSEADLCSPLCICTCCAATVQLTIAGVLIPTLYTPHNTPIVIPYQEKIASNCFNSIWQPPRLA